jgi:uncharacterized MAPEG superfamily protein
MTIPFWCLFGAVILPYVWFAFAAPFRASQFGKDLDGRTPRAQEKDLRGRASRAHGAHVNAFEALAYFSPAVLVAHVTHADPDWSARLAVVFLVCRVLHGVVYLADRPRPRTILFALGFLASVGLFVLAARAP